MSRNLTTCEMLASPSSSSTERAFCYLPPVDVAEIDHESPRAYYSKSVVVGGRFAGIIHAF